MYENLFSLFFIFFRAFQNSYLCVELLFKKKKKTGQKKGYNLDVALTLEF
jgi:hypothetical protein